MISALGTVLGLASEQEDDFSLEELLEDIKDPTGTFYKYTLAVSIINRRLQK